MPIAGGSRCKQSGCSWVEHLHLQISTHKRVSLDPARVQWTLLASRLTAFRQEGRTRAKGENKFSKSLSACTFQCEAYPNGTNSESSKTRVSLKECRAQRIHTILEEREAQGARISKSADHEYSKARLPLKEHRAQRVCAYLRNTRSKEPAFQRVCIRPK